MKQCYNRENYIADLLDDNEKKLFETHITRCETCRREIKKANRLKESLALMWKISTPPDGSTPESILKGKLRLLERLKTPPPRKLRQIAWGSSIAFLIILITLAIITFNIKKESPAKTDLVKLKLISSHNTSVSIIKPDTNYNLSTKSGGKLLVAIGRDKIGLDGDTKINIRILPGKTVIKLLNGRIAGEKDPDGAQKTLTILANDSKVNIVGTIFLVSSQPHGETSVGVKRGHVVVDISGNNIVNLFAGDFLTIPNKGKESKSKLSNENSAIITRILETATANSVIRKNTPKNIKSSKDINSQVQSNVNVNIDTKIHELKLKEHKSNGKTTNKEKPVHKDIKSKTIKKKLIPEIFDATAVKKMIINKNYSKAESVITRWLSKNSGDAYAWWLLGESMRKRGAAKSAVKAYSKSVKLGGTSLANRARYYNAVIYQDKLGNQNKAVSLLKSYLGASSHPPLERSAHYRLAKALIALGKKGAAIKVLRKMIATYGGDWQKRAADLLKSTEGVK